MLFCRNSFRRILYHKVRAHFDSVPLLGSCQGSIGPDLISQGNGFSDRVFDHFTVVKLPGAGSEDIPNVRSAVLYGGLLLVICCKCKKGSYVQCNSKPSGIFWTCPHCQSKQLQKGNPDEVAFTGQRGWCTSPPCGKSVWIRKFESKKLDDGVRLGLGGIGACSALLCLVCPPAAAVADTVAIVTAGTGGAWNMGMGAATEDGWRCCRGAFLFLGAGCDLAGDAAAEAIGRGLDVLEVLANITQTLLENDPVPFGLACFSAVAVGVDICSVEAGMTADTAKKMYQEAKSNTRKLAQSIRKGGPQAGVKIGDETIKSLRLAASATKGLETMHKLALIDKQTMDSLKDLMKNLSEVSDYVFADLPDFLIFLADFQDTVHVEKR